MAQKLYDTGYIEHLERRVKQLDYLADLLLEQVDYWQNKYLQATGGHFVQDTTGIAHPTSKVKIIHM